MTRIITVVLTITQRSQKDVSMLLVVVYRWSVNSSGSSLLVQFLCPAVRKLLIFLFPAVCALLWVLSSGFYSFIQPSVYCSRFRPLVLLSCPSVRTLLWVLSSGVLVASNGPCSPLRFLSVFLLQEFSCFLAKSPTPFCFFVLDSEVIHLLPIHCL